MVVAEIPVMKLRPSGGQRGLGSAELEARSAYHIHGRSQPNFILTGAGLAVPPGIAMSCWRESSAGLRFYRGAPSTNWLDNC
mgnify:CR=1 FL=1